jgi:hypothetical protein
MDQGGFQAPQTYQAFSFADVAKRFVAYIANSTIVRHGPRSDTIVSHGTHYSGAEHPQNSRSFPYRLTYESRSRNSSVFTKNRQKTRKSGIVRFPSINPRFFEFPRNWDLVPSGFDSLKANRISSNSNSVALPVHAPCKVGKALSVTLVCFCIAFSPASHMILDLKAQSREKIRGTKLGENTAKEIDRFWGIDFRRNGGI